MKLPSMIDYVWMQHKLLSAGAITNDQYINRTKKFADFLDTEIALYMIVPCTDDGEPITGEEFDPDGSITVMYSNAKNKVLFKDFLWVQGTGLFYSKKSNGNWRWRVHDSGNSPEKLRFEDRYMEISETFHFVKDLVPFNFELTENARKELNL